MISSCREELLIFRNGTNQSWDNSTTYFKVTLVEIPDATLVPNLQNGRNCRSDVKGKSRTDPVNNKTFESWPTKAITATGNSSGDACSTAALQTLGKICHDNGSIESDEQKVLFGFISRSN